MSEADVLHAVSAVTDPELRRPLGELDMIRSVSLDGGVAHIAVALTIVGCPASDRIERRRSDRIRTDRIRRM